MSLLTTHIVVQFADSSDTVNAQVEIDDREFGFNGGKTTFYPGDSPALLLFMPSGYIVDSVYSSAGTVSLIGDTTKVVEGDYVFANEDTASLSYPYAANLVYSWMGTNLGALGVSEYELRLPARPVDPVTHLPVPPYRVGISHATYDSNAKAYRLSAVPLSVSQVVVYFVLRKP
jgi:hypothetical protein